MYSEFSERELSAIHSVSSAIDISAGDTANFYGSPAQKVLMELMEDVLSMAEARDTDKLQNAIFDTVTLLRKFQTDEKLERHIFVFLRKKHDREDALRQKIDAVADTVESLYNLLEQCHLDLTKNSEILTQKHSAASDCHKMHLMFIRAGVLRLSRERETTLANYREIARRTELKKDADSVERIERYCRSFQSKLQNLELTTGICQDIQPLIQELKSINDLFSAALHSVLVGAVSGWKDCLCTEELITALHTILTAQEANSIQRNAVHGKLLQIYGQLQQNVSEVV